MNLPKLLGAAALVAALAVPSAAQAAAPWSEPATVAGSSGQAGGAPNVLFTSGGGAIAFNAPGSFPGSQLLSSVNGAAAAPWPGALNFDSTFGSFAAADRIIYAGSDGERRVNVAIAPGPGSEWRVQKRGPQTGGARVATAAAPGHTVAAFATFEPGGGSVYVVRQNGVQAPGATERISGPGSIRSISVAVNASGDVLAAWDRHGTIESRMYYASSKRWMPVTELGEVTGALHITAAVGADHRAIVGWVDQLINEGGTGQKATVWATARTNSRGFLLPAKQLEAYPDTTIPGGTVIKAAYTSDGRGIIAWSGRNAVRAALVNGRSIRAPQDLGPAAPDESQADPGLYALAVSPDGQAVVTMVAAVDSTHNQVLAAPLADGAWAFGPTETVSAPLPFLHQPSAAFDPRTGQAVVAWQVASQDRVEVSERPAP